jgi:hypothetical protein
MALDNYFWNKIEGMKLEIIQLGPSGLETIRSAAE